MTLYQPSGWNPTRRIRSMSLTPATDVLYTKQVNGKVYCPPLVTPPTSYWPCCYRSTNQYSTGLNVAVLCCVNWMINCLKTLSCYVLLISARTLLLCKCNKNYPLLCKCLKFLLCYANIMKNMQLPLKTSYLGSWYTGNDTRVIHRKDYITCVFWEKQWKKNVMASSENIQYV